VPDLALSVPQPTNGGRTYLFRLRPGIRYSDGHVVRASDFVRAAVRVYRIRSPGAPFFAELVGGRACLARPATCRLHQGVVADDSARTVSFHLTTPDPDFLFKLALGLIVPVPPDTPMHEVGARPIPGTGPYEFAAVGRTIRFARNLRFREWSHAAQPDGNPDTIEWHFGLAADQEVRAVVQGRGDWTGDLPSDLSKFARRNASQLRSNAFPTDFFLQLNTRRPPFDDLRARRALNYAVDRAAIVRLHGGSIANTPSCQVIPPGLPGYRRYCPYTLDPRGDGRWTAPDLRRARALVAASRTRGERVTVWSVSDTGAPDSVAVYMAGVLRRLGYRARVQAISGEHERKLPAAARWNMQLQPVGFGPDYPSASEIYSLFLACAGAFTWHHFCDPRLDRRALRAESMRLSNPLRSATLWSQIDRELVDRAVWVPLTNERIVDFVSPRVRNYEFSPVYHFLPAQVWLR